jgi:hypothetical protein
MEPIRSADVRLEAGEKEVKGHEGELPASKRLIARLRSTYRWLDVLVVDALYASGPFLTLATELKFGVIAVLKKDANEPLKEALRQGEDRGPDEVRYDKENKERIELWNCPEISTLGSYHGPIRMVRGTVHKDKAGTTHTWCFAVIGVARTLSNAGVLKMGRRRWHIENTGFNQWTQYWHFEHVFSHSEKGLPSQFWIFFLVFNILQLFVYRHLGGYGRDGGKDVTRTVLRLIDEVIDDLARFTEHSSGTRADPTGACAGQTGLPAQRLCLRSDRLSEGDPPSRKGDACLSVHRTLAGLAFRRTAVVCPWVPHSPFQSYDVAALSSLAEPLTFPGASLFCLRDRRWDANGVCCAGLQEHSSWQEGTAF